MTTAARASCMVAATLLATTVGLAQGKNNPKPPVKWPGTAEFRCNQGVTPCPAPTPSDPSPDQDRILGDGGNYALKPDAEGYGRRRHLHTRTATCTSIWARQANIRSRWTSPCLPRMKLAVVRGTRNAFLTEG